MMYRIAVIIPAKTNACQQVDQVLRHLGQQDILIVALNGPAKAEYRSISDPRLIWLETGPSISAAHARNLGVRSLNETAKALLFCDADDQVTPSWLSSLARPLLNSSADLVGGLLRLRRDLSKEIIVTPTIDYYYRQALFGGSMGITYNAWQLLNGFDESLKYCEDTDIAWRAISAGLRIQVVAEAIVDIHLRNSFQEFEQRFQWGKAAVKLLQKHDLSLNHLPGLMDLLAHKKATGFAMNPSLAAIAQWIGHWAGRLQKPLHVPLA